MPPVLSDLVAPGRCALLLQEVQPGVVGEESGLPELAAAGRAVGMVGHLERLTVAARSAGIPVVHCTAAHMTGGFGANRNARLFAGARKGTTLGEADGARMQPVPSVYQEGDLVVPRYHGLSPLQGTPLDSLLRNEGITTVVVSGVSLNVAIPNLVFDAVNRAYQVVVVGDAVAGVPVEYGQQILQNTIRLRATVVTTDELAAVWAEA